MSIVTSFNLIDSTCKNCYFLKLNRLTIHNNACPNFISKFNFSVEVIYFKPGSILDNKYFNFREYIVVNIICEFFHHIVHLHIIVPKTAINQYIIDLLTAVYSFKFFLFFFFTKKVMITTCRIPRAISCI